MNSNAINQAIKNASIEELEQIRDTVQAEMEERRRKRREEAMAEIRRIAGAEHIPVRFDVKSPAKGNGKKPLYRGGRQYQHPSQPELLWNAKGQKPNWLRELEKRGGRAVEFLQEEAHDNAVPPLKKMG